jgi:hypothetical protein
MCLEEYVGSKCVIVKGTCANSCGSNDCGVNSNKPYCVYNNNNKCDIDECSPHNSDECKNEEGCIWDQSIGLCTSKTCSDISNDVCIEEYVGSKCVIVKGTCVNSCGSSDCGVNSNKPYCVSDDDNKCIFDECSLHNSDECKNEEGCFWDININYNDNGLCINKICSDISSDSCIEEFVGSKCIIVSGSCVDSCSSNDCGETSSKPYCVYYNNNICGVDECSSHTSDECKNAKGCFWNGEIVYMDSSGLCSNKMCSEISSDACIEEYVGSRCVVVRGWCVDSCSSNDCGETSNKPYCVYDNNNNCGVDACSSHTLDECQDAKGCFWDQSIFNINFYGLCTGKICSDISGDACSEEYVGSRCVIVSGSCVDSCGSSDCGQNSNKPYCVYDNNNNCGVDEC